MNKSYKAWKKWYNSNTWDRIAEKNAHDIYKTKKNAFITKQNQLYSSEYAADNKGGERIVLTGVNNDLEVFNGVDIMATKQFLIGVNAILTHPNNITETLPPNIVVISPSTTAARGNWSWSDVASTNTWATTPWLNSDGSWAAKTDSVGGPVTTDSYVVLDLSKDSTVIGLVLQGRNNIIEYVKKLKVKTSTDNLSYEFVDSDNNGNVFNIEYTPWNSAVNTSIQVPLMFPNYVIARYVRIYPTDDNYYSYPSMRVGVMVQDKPYHAGMKQGLTTSILKGLLMQGNKNIPPDDSTEAVKEVIPDSGTDIDDAEIKNNLTSISNGFSKSISTSGWRFEKPTFVILILVGSDDVTSIDIDTEPSGNSYIAFSLNYFQYSLFHTNETNFTYDTALQINAPYDIPKDRVKVLYSQYSLEKIRGFGLN